MIYYIFESYDQEDLIRIKSKNFEKKMPINISINNSFTFIQTIFIRIKLWNEIFLLNFKS